MQLDNVDVIEADDGVGPFVASQSGCSRIQQLNHAFAVDDDDAFGDVIEHELGELGFVAGGVANRSGFLLFLEIKNAHAYILT